MKNNTQFLIGLGLVFLTLISASVGYTQTSRADIVLIIDSSGSMDDNDPNDLRKDAAKFFIGLADSDVQIAIVDFDGDATTFAQLTFANAVGKSKLKNSVDRVDSDGSTDLDAGLREGFTTLNRSNFPNTKKAAVMLTDGDDTSNTRQIVASYANKNWSIYTIGLGDDVDKAKLETIAGSTLEGEYFPITLENMQTVYKKIIGDILDDSELYKDKGYINKNQKVTKYTSLDDSITKTKFAVYHDPGHKIDMKLKDPNGIMITPQVADSTADMNYDFGDNYIIYVIDNPKSGKYDMELTGKTLPDQGGKYDLTVTGTSDFVTRFRPFNHSYSVNDTIDIGVEVKEKIGNTTRIVSGASTSAEVVRPNGRIETLNLSYQGNGVYSNTYRHLDLEGPYLLRVLVKSGGLSRKIQEQVVVGAIENVFIDGSTLIPAAGETLTQSPSIISAVISGPAGRINSNSIVLKVNGRIVSHTYDQVNQLVSFRPGVISGGLHSVQLSVQDVGGKTIEATWPFTLQPSLPQAYIYWSSYANNKIQRANLDGSNVQNLVTTNEPEGLSLDITDGKMYWTSANPAKIQRANLDGSNVQGLVTTGLQDPEGTALDIAGGKMYWTDYEAERIQRANLDGSNVQTLVTNIQGLVSPRQIALDVAARKMYWTDSDTDKVQRANLDGSNVQDLVTGLGHPVGIALDVTGGKMYWADAGTDKIQRANLDGSNVQDLVTGLPAPFSITLDATGGKMYWTDVATEKIQCANLDGSNVQDLVTTGLTDPSSIALIPTHIVPPPVQDNKILASYQGFHVINFGLDETQDHNAACKAQLGSNARLADWNDIVAYHGAGGSLADFVAGLKMSVDGGPPPTQDQIGNSYTISRDGNPIWGNTGRGYYVSYHNHNKPGNYLAHENIDNYYLSLGSWPGTRPTLCYSGLSVVREDVDGNGIVNLQDLRLVAENFEQTGEHAADVNDDGVVDIEDILLVLAAVEAANGAPSLHTQALHLLTTEEIQQWLFEARRLANKSIAHQRGILMLEQLLALLTPKETALLTNYPNPFNPETWIPYQLAKPADVTLAICDINGHVVRTLKLGHQRAGVYYSRIRAAHWDGKNEQGERVASGIYFYTLKAGNFSATKKMLIRK